MTELKFDVQTATVEEICVEWQKTQSDELMNMLLKRTEKWIYSYILNTFKGFVSDDCFEDLVQVGKFSVFRAAKEYKVEMGCKFLTYAAHKIKCSIREEVKREQFRTARYRNERDNWCKALHFSLAYDELENPSITKTAYIAWEMGIDEKKAEEYLREACTRKQVISLNTYISDEQESSFIDFIQDSEAEAKMYECECIDRNKQLVQILEKELKEKEFRAIYLYYGLDRGTVRTLQNVAYTMGISRERFRQLINNVISRLHRSQITMNLLKELV